jgi:phenylpropionate dioxygenase-like ring-hydroxylating dioxygenase large terminal subunit
MMVTSLRQVHRTPTQEQIDAYYAAMRQFWHPVLPASALPESGPVATELLGEPLVIARLNGDLVVMEDVCRHFQARLSQGEIREITGHGECLMCPYHGWTYAEGGQCVDIPQLAAGREIPASAKVPTYRISERYGLLWVCLDSHSTFEIPALGLDDPTFVQGPLRTYPLWAAAAPRVIMAALDDTHGPWVHEGLVGDRAHPAPPEHKVWREGTQYLKVAIDMVQPKNATIDEGGDEAFQEVHLLTTLSIPNVIHFDIQAKGSTRKTIIWQAVCPRRWDATETFWGSARNYDLDAPVWNAAFEELQDTLREQDRQIVEGQRPWLLPPFWTKIEVPLRPADLPLIEYQNWLDELGVTIGI